MEQAQSTSLPEPRKKRPQFVADDQVVVGLQGLRYVSKEDRSWSGEDNFLLKVDYRGKEEDFSYKDKAKRDQMFEAIRAALIGQK